MNTRDTRQYEMLVRVIKFGEARRSAFPDTSGGAKALAAVATAVEQLLAYGAAKKKTIDEGTEARKAAKRELLAHLRSMNRTARLIARTSPGFAGRFTLPRSKPTDQAVLAAGRSFLEAAEVEKDRFLAQGMMDTFVTDLKSLVEAFAGTIHESEAGKERKAVAQKGLAAALASGLDAVRALDIIVANQFGGDRDAMSAWEHDRKVVVTRRRSREAVSSEPAVSEGTPAVGVSPAVESTPAAGATPAAGSTPTAVTPSASTAVAVEPSAIAKAS